MQHGWSKCLNLLWFVHSFDIYEQDVATHSVPLSKQDHIMLKMKAKEKGCM